MHVGAVFHFSEHWQMPFCTIYYHSPGGDAAAAFYQIRYFIRDIFGHQRATMQRTWRSLRSPSALVNFADLNVLFRLRSRDTGQSIIITQQAEAG